MGAVYRAVDRQSGRTVAVKLMHPGDGSRIARFMLEARVLAKLRHPGIVRYIAHGATLTDEPYLVMEWLDGATLEDHLATHRMSVADIVEMAIQISDALVVAHAGGIAHRDIKPSNLFVCGGSSAGAKLIDFGVAAADFQVHTLTATGAILGTPAYMAPERITSRPVANAPGDVFSLGCVLYRCLAGQAPFRASDAIALMAKIAVDDAPKITTVRSDVPAPLSVLLERMLEKDPYDRPDAEAVARELRTIVADVHDATIDGEGAAVLTHDEHRVVCVVMAQLPDVSRGWAAVSFDDRDDVIGYPGDAPTVTMQAARGGTSSLDQFRAIGRQYGGRLELLSGGALVSSHTAMGTVTDLAAQAARFALTLRNRVPDVRVSMSIGRSERDAEATGEVIDRAARLLLHPQHPDHSPTGIRIDATLVGLLDRSFEIRDHTLYGELPQLEATRQLLGRSTPCVGRDGELRILRSLAELSADEPSARAVLVTASPGVGKSRLRQEFLRTASESQRAVVWFAVGDPVSAGSRLVLLANALRRSAGIVEGEPLEIRRRKLGSYVEKTVGVGDAARITCFLGELTRIPYEGDQVVELPAARLDARVMSDQLRRAWLDLLRAACARGPVFLIFDDLQWGDSPSIAFIDAALRELEDQPLFVLAMARPEVHDLFPRLWVDRDLHEIRLRNLPRRASAQLVAELLPDLAPEVSDRLVALAAGNAFYLEELIRAVADGGSAESLPDTIVAMAQMRLEQLPAGGRQLLRAASVFGTVFWPRGVRHLVATERERPDIDNWLDLLSDQEIIESIAREKFPEYRAFRFRHDVLREAAYASLTPSDRQLAHRLAGDWLTEAGEQNPLVLAEHYERGGALDKALPRFLEAAQASLQAHDYDAAPTLVHRGGACGARGAELGMFRLVETRACAWSTAGVRGEEVAEQAMQLLDTGSEAWWEAAALRMNMAIIVGKTGPFVDTLQQVSSVEFPASTTHSAVFACAYASMALHRVGRHGQAKELVDRIAGLDEASAGLIAAGYTSIALVYQARYADSSPGAAYDHASRAVQCFTNAGDRWGLAGAEIELAKALCTLGAYDVAAAMFREILVRMRDNGVRYLEDATVNYLGLAIARQGRLDDAIELFVASLGARGVTGGLSAGLARFHLAAVYRLAGQLDKAEAEARAAARASLPLPPMRPAALASLARIVHEQGKTEDAQKLMAEARIAVSRSPVIDEGEAFYDAIDIAMHLEAGERAAAAAKARDAYRRLMKRRDTIEHEHLRRSFVEASPDNADVIRLARELDVVASEGS